MLFDRKELGTSKAKSDLEKQRFKKNLTCSFTTKNLSLKTTTTKLQAEMNDG